jgi:hypothetical protein
MPAKPKSALTYEWIKEMALALPEVCESTSYGTAALKVRGKLMVRQKEDLETVVVRTTWEAREQLLALYPDAFFVTDHYRNYPWVLLRPAASTPELVSTVLEQAWQLVAPPALRRKRLEQQRSA